MKFIKKNFWFLFLFVCLGFSQNNKDLSKLKYEDIINLYFENELDTLKTSYYANLYISKAKIDKDSNNIAKGYYLLAIKYYANDYEKAIVYLDKVIEYSYGLVNNNFPVVAYCEKADLLSKLSRRKEAFECFLIAEKYALKNKDLDNYYYIRYRIGIFKSEHIGEVKEAIKLYKECLEYYKKKNLEIAFYHYQYHKIIFALADGYSSINDYKNGSLYNEIGFKSSSKYKDEKMKSLFILSEGALQVKKENYKVAFDSLTKALNKMKTLTNIGQNVLAGNYYLGKIYEKTNQHKLAEKYYLKVDSIYKKDKYITPEFVSGYTFLINYYKLKKDKDNQLKFLNTFIEIDGKFRENYVQWNQMLKYEYDIPHLIKEKEGLIDDLTDDKVKIQWFFMIMVVVSLSILIYTFQITKQRKIEKIKFEKLINELSADNNKSSIINTSIDVSKEEDDIGINKEIVDKIIEKFKEFEENKHFLKNDVSLITLSQTFETNSKYISKVINYYSKKSLTNYINDLRIEYLVEELKQNKSLRKYTINAISEEIGFNNSESFSKAFYKKTGLKPSYFIKELEKK